MSINAPAQDGNVKLLPPSADHIKALLAEHISEAELLLSVTILYSDENAHAEAMRFNKFLTQMLGPDLGFQTSQWRLDELRYLRPGAVMMELAEQTDVLVLVTNEQDDLPITVRRWIALWLNQADPGCALVCLVGSATDRCPVWPATANLRNACEHAGVSFFASSFHAQPAPEAPQASQPEMLITVHCSLTGVSHWGINE
jgi:hypothetical protein